MHGSDQRGRVRDRLGVWVWKGAKGFSVFAGVFAGVMGLCKLSRLPLGAWLSC